MTEMEGGDPSPLFFANEWELSDRRGRGTDFCENNPRAILSLDQRLKGGAANWMKI
jgi:hypothetical protein